MHFYANLHIGTNSKIKYIRHFSGSSYNHPPIGVSTPRRFSNIRHISSHTDSMRELQHRNVAKSTSIRTRFKRLTSIEQAKLRIKKNVLWCLWSSTEGGKICHFQCVINYHISFISAYGVKNGVELILCIHSIRYSYTKDLRWLKSSLFRLLINPLACVGDMSLQVIDLRLELILDDNPVRNVRPMRAGF